MSNLINLQDDDFKDFLISNMAVGQVDFWWQCYTLLNEPKPIKIKKIPKPKPLTDKVINEFNTKTPKET